MRVLVTGSGGFVGKRLVRELEGQGHEVEGFDVAEGKDICNAEQVRAAVKGKEQVFHLAAVLDETARNIGQVNVQGTQNVIDACIQERVGRLVFLSTMGVVGDAEGVQDEQSAYAPVTRYERSKQLAEERVLNAQEALGVTVVRAPIVYGAGSYWLKVIGYAKKNRPLIGSGNNTWQMIYVQDLVEALVWVAEHDSSSGEVFVPAEGEAHTLKEVYLEMRKHMGMEGEPAAVPKWVAKIISYPLVVIAKLTGKKPFLSPGMVERAVRNREYDSSKIRKLGWAPKYSLEQGMTETFKELGGNLG